MTDERYNALMSQMDLSLTEEEIEEGWHFCWDWDGLVVGPGMIVELACCSCESNPPNIKLIELQKQAREEDKTTEDL